MYFRCLYGTLALCTALSAEAAARSFQPDVRPASSLDLNRYAGKWYEIARFENRFERGLVGVTADYTLRPDGKIRVVNSGYEGALNGKYKQAVGHARQPDPREAGRLEVAFFLWFYAPYHVLMVDSGYRYALVSGADDRYLWLLSRTPQLPEPARDELLQEAQRRGFDTSRLVWVKQPVAPLEPLVLRSLTVEEKRVIVDKGTEAPFTGIYYDHKEKGIYRCKQCGTPLYRSADKFDSGCGWPAFDDAIPGAVRELPDRDGRRTEILCVRCGAHLGHVFRGEGFTSKDTRHCVNSISLDFQPQKTKP